MRSFWRVFCAGLVLRLACAPLLLQWFDRDERTLLEFAHFHAHGRLQPFLESRFHLTNQTAPWLLAWILRACDHFHFNSPWAYLIGIHAAVGVWTWLGLWQLVRWFRQSHGVDGDRVAWVLAWFFAFFWAFPLLYSRGLPDTLSLTPLCFLWMALERRRPWRAGWWTGWSVVLRYANGLWGLGAAVLAAVRWRISPKRGDPRWARRAAVGVFLGCVLALIIGGLADRLVYGGRILSSVAAYWDFNRPHGPVGEYFGPGSLALYWHWFAYIFSPWLAPVFMIAAAYALAMSPSLLVFCAPYLLWYLFTPYREVRFMMPVLPFLALALAVAVQRGWFTRLLWIPLRNSSIAMGILRPVVGLLVGVNLIWYPLYAWGQWKSGQAELIRHYRDLESHGVRLALFSDPVEVLGLDVLVPPSVPWLDANCRWHRPLVQSDSRRPLWVLGHTATRGCRLAVGGRVPWLPEWLARSLKIRQAALYDCGTGEAVLQEVCPGGVKPAAPNEPSFGKI